MSEYGGISPRRGSVVKQDEDVFNWKEYHEGMAGMMVKERLREAIGRRDRGMLERAITEAKSSGQADDDGSLRRAQNLIDIIDRKKTLRETLASNDLEAIKKELDTIKSNILFAGSMQRELQEAQLYADGLERMFKLKRDILKMDKRTMSEVRRYHTPPEALHEVIQATLLLLGEDEGTTSDWRTCQNLMDPSGPHGMNKRIMDFDITALHPEIVTRVRQLLGDYTLGYIQPISKGAATFYVWATSIVDQAETTSRKTSGVAAASITRQKELLGKPFSRYDSPRRKRKNYSTVTPRNGTISKGNTEFT